jgi:hypothetical protein
MFAAKMKPRDWDDGVSRGVSVPAVEAERPYLLSDPTDRVKPNGCGRFPHSDTCEQLARSGWFNRDAAHTLFALARQPDIDTAFQNEGRP